jgi:hypothetical protein
VDPIYLCKYPLLESSHSVPDKGKDLISYSNEQLFHLSLDRPSAGGSHMSGIWGRDKPRQAFCLQMWREAALKPRPGDLVRQL